MGAWHWSQASPVTTLILREVEDMGESLIVGLYTLYIDRLYIIDVSKLYERKYNYRPI